MSFSSLMDPRDWERTNAALDVCWKQVIDEIPIGKRGIEYARLALIIAGEAPFTMDEDELTSRALHQFRQHELISAD